MAPVVQYHAVVFKHLHGHVQRAGDLPRVALVDVFGQRVVRPADQPLGRLRARPALRPAVAAAIPVAGVDELVAERAATLGVAERRVDDDEAQRVVVQAAQPVRQPALLHAHAKRSRLTYQIIQHSKYWNVPGGAMARTMSLPVFGHAGRTIRRVPCQCESRRQNAGTRRAGR